MVAECYRRRWRHEVSKKKKGIRPFFFLSWWESRQDLQPFACAAPFSPLLKKSFFWSSFCCVDEPQQHAFVDESRPPEQAAAAASVFFQPDNRPFINNIWGHTAPQTGKTSYHKKMDWLCIYMSYCTACCVCAYRATVVLVVETLWVIWIAAERLSSRSNTAAAVSTVTVAAVELFWFRQNLTAPTGIWLVQIRQQSSTAKRAKTVDFKLTLIRRLTRQLPVPTW